MIFALYTPDVHKEAENFWTPQRIEQYRDEQEAVKSFARRLVGGTHVFPWATHEATQEEVTGVNFDGAMMTLFRDPYDRTPCGAITVGGVEQRPDGKGATMLLGGMWVTPEGPEVFAKGFLVLANSDELHPDCDCGMHFQGDDIPGDHNTDGTV